MIYTFDFNGEDDSVMNIMEEYFNFSEMELLDEDDRKVCIAAVIEALVTTMVKPRRVNEILSSAAVVLHNTVTSMGLYFNTPTIYAMLYEIYGTDDYQVIKKEVTTTIDAIGGVWHVELRKIDLNRRLFKLEIYDELAI